MNISPLIASAFLNSYYQNDSIFPIPIHSTPTQFATVSCEMDYVFIAIMFDGMSVQMSILRVIPTIRDCFGILRPQTSCFQMRSWSLILVITVISSVTKYSPVP